MASYNKVILVGNLTRDPESRYLPSGACVCEFGVAVNRKWKAESGDLKEEVSFFNVVAFGKTGETIAQYCRKGKSVLVDGRLKQETWEDKQSGAKKSAVKIVCETISFLGPPPDGSTEERQPARSTPRAAGPPPPADAAAPDDTDDVPF